MKEKEPLSVSLGKYLGMILGLILGGLLMGILAGINVFQKIPLQYSILILAFSALTWWLIQKKVELNTQNSNPEEIHIQEAEAKRVPGPTADPAYDAAYEYEESGKTRKEAWVWYCEQNKIDVSDKALKKAFMTALGRRAEKASQRKKDTQSTN